MRKKREGIRLTRFSPSTRLIGLRTRPLIAMASNRYYKDVDGLHLDMGAFVSYNFV